MRASQSPGASSSARVGTICGPSHSRLRPSSPRAFDDAAAERGALFVVAPLELESEQAVDERGRVAALEPVPAQRFVDAFVRAHHAFADGLHHDVGVALEHADEALQLLEHRPLPFRPHRAEQRAGVTEAAERLHRLGVREVEATELLFERLGIHLVRADVVLGELPEALAHPRDRTLRAVHGLAQDERVAQLVGGKRPRLGEVVDVARDEHQRGRGLERERQVVLAERLVRELTDHPPGPHAEQHRQQVLHQEAEERFFTGAGFGVGRVRNIGAGGGAAERARECFEHGREAVDRRARPSLAVDACAREP